jgi:hypothetical protein
LPVGAEEARRKLIETLRRRRSGVSPVEEARERSRAKFRSRLSSETLEGSNPGEHPAVGVLNTRSVARDSPVGSNPRNRGPSSRPSHFRVRRYTDGRNGKWVHPVGNDPDTNREEKAPKGESQERCRYETRPARVTKGVNRHEGSQTLKAERSGQAKARAQWTFEPCMCCREAKPMRGACLLRQAG